MRPDFNEVYGVPGATTTAIRTRPRFYNVCGHVLGESTFPPSASNQHCMSDGLRVVVLLWQGRAVREPDVVDSAGHRFTR
jgi:hypothetical protein